MERTSCLLVNYFWLLTIAILVPSADAHGVPQLIESQSQNRYQPNWSSLDSRPLPPWYNAAKVGIFIHWGVYAVPSFGSEWFWKNWRTTKVDSYVQFMSRNYAPQFTYQQFASDFTGELFNATEWTELFVASGARYIVLTSKHHDGYTMWPSEYSFSWNSMDVGLHRDVVGELERAVRKDGRLRFGLYHSLFEWFNPMYIKDQINDFNSNEFVVKKVLPEMVELVQEYKPEVLWSDGDWEAPYEYWNSTEFLAWLYNDSPVNATVVTNDRWGRDMVCNHGGFYTCTDRYNPGVLQSHKWENAMTLDRKSWGHRTDAKLTDFLTAKELIVELVSTVSCGGNILINVGPNKAGTIEPIFEERLREMGKWLGVNGEAVYEAEPWLHQNDTVTQGVWYTSQTIEKRPVVYAFVLEYPYKTGDIRLYALAGKCGNETKITILGDTQSLKFNVAEDHLLVSFPKKESLDQHGLSLVWTLRIQL